MGSGVGSLPRVQFGDVGVRGDPPGPSEHPHERSPEHVADYGADECETDQLQRVGRRDEAEAILLATERVDVDDGREVVEMFRQFQIHDHADDGADEESDHVERELRGGSDAQPADDPLKRGDADTVRLALLLERFHPAHEGSPVGCRRHAVVFDGDVVAHAASQVVRRDVPAVGVVIAWGNDERFPASPFPATSEDEQCEPAGSAHAAVVPQQHGHDYGGHGAYDQYDKDEGYCDCGPAHGCSFLWDYSILMG